MTLTMQENPRLEAAIPMTDAEWQARVQLAACYRVFDLLGWTETDLQPHHAARARAASGCS